MKFNILAGLCMLVFFWTGPVSGQGVDYQWVDSVYKSLTPDQRIAQLLVIRAYSSKDSIYNDSLVRIVKQHGIGGVCFFKGSPVRQAILTNRLQQESQTPMLITIDAEWGVGMRLDSAFSFPRQMALGAMDNDSLIYEMGRLVGRSCKRLGIQVNFAPVADINNNPNNPVINFRSFGENREQVARKSMMYMKGMQKEGVMAVAKHFPGHGDTDSDSHYTLPVINHLLQRLDSVELYPFRVLIREGLAGVMVAHLYIPSFDSVKDTPATLSKNVITGLLKEQLKFRGYVFTDALDMKGVTKYFKPGEIEVIALQAGNDILLLPKNAAIAIRGIRTAIDSGWMSDSLLEARCKRMLALKYELGLKRAPVIKLDSLIADLNPPEAEVLNREMVNSSMVLLKNELRIIPLTGLDRRKIAVLSMGDSTVNLFQSTLNRYAAMGTCNIPRKFKKALADSIFKQVSACDILIIGLHGITSNAANKFGFTNEMIRLIDTLTRVNRTILTLFGTPYAMAVIPNITKPEAILVAHQDNPTTETAAAEAIFGGIGVNGKLPVTSSVFAYGTGDETEKTRLELVLPEELGIPRQALNVIDSIALAGIASYAYPGCQVLLAKDGKIFYEKAFGQPRYEDTVKVTMRHLYDLASVTKVAATTLVMMKLYDEGKIKPDDNLGKYLPMLKGSNKSHLLIRDVMTHQAGLQDWIPFYKSTLKNGQPDPALYQPEPSAKFPVRVAQNLYIRKDYADTVYQSIISSSLRTSPDYKYSDVGFILLRLIAEQVSGQPFDQYLAETYYKPLGLSTMGFNPRGRFDLSRLIPTEYDNDFRLQLLWGDVHDHGASMLGGIAGHAGLFSNAIDLAVILRMLLQEGSYGGKQFLSPATVREFTRVQYPENGNRRGLGFDKPMLNPLLDGPSCSGTSPQSFGHSGFTGTYIWADPANGLIYVFLSNRIHPSAANNKLSEMNIRTNIHQSVYDLFERYQIK
ncbi:MAG: glycoside hydrolase family 3 N-terminal domain-containing protein [Bacteroidales bacterium]|nr:glycoside hydrolase family 3 N-terminal domain-containing protein [Bacteroidales bacterium]